MECFTSLLAIAVIWLIVRDIRASNRIATLETMLGNQQTVTSALAERIASLRRQLSKLVPEAEVEKVTVAPPAAKVVVPPESLTPVPSPIAHPSPGRGAPPPIAVDSPLSRSGG